MRNKKLKLAVGVSVAALAAGGTIAFAANAGADPSSRTSTSVVDGLGDLTDDFGDHAEELGGPLSDHGDNSWGTDTVAMWQAILVADGKLALEDIDGYFGSATAEATELWQEEHGVEEDEPGTVGAATWARADDKLVASGEQVRYQGAPNGDGGVGFERRGGSDGRYRFLSVTDGDGSGLDNIGDGTTVEHFKLTVEMGEWS